MKSITKSDRKSIPIMVTYRGKQIVAGCLTPGGVFKKNVEAKDKLIALNSYGFDLEYMADVLAKGCKVIELKVKDTGEKYRIDIETFEEKAVIRSLGKFGPRKYCPLRYWTRLDQKPNNPVQLALV